ncbi:MAG: acyl-CoA desaturase [Fibrobacteria bacterium]
MEQQSPTFFAKVVTWFDTHAQAKLEEGHANQEKWIFPFPFILMSVSTLAVIYVGFSWVAFATAVFLYIVRMFGITGVYHRYFSHKTYKTSRWFQFVLALLGNSAAERGPLWWAAHHRHHHRFSDTKNDTHSPSQKGFWDAHMLWWSRRKNVATRLDLVPDLAKYPELMFLDRFDSVVPLSLGVLLAGLGMLLHRYFPALGTNGLQMFVWGFVVSTVVLFHGVATINSLSHVYGSRRFQTTDTSRNNWFLAILTLGEGWHNNHHHYCNSTRQGFFWWEIDITYYGLKALAMLGLVWDLKPVPQRLLRPQPAPGHEVVRPHEVVPEPASVKPRIAGVAGLLPGMTSPLTTQVPARSPDLPTA